MPGIPTILLLLIAITVAVSLRGFKQPSFFQDYKFQVLEIVRGERYRMLSAGFLHVDNNHLFLNMFTLYIFGGNAIAGLGNLNFILLYLGSLLFGNLFAFYFHRNTPYYSAVGASGAVMGVVYGSILMFPEMKLMLILFPIPMPAFVFGVGYLVYTLFGMKRQQDNIGHTAHFGGAISGMVITLAIHPYLVQKSFFTLGIMTVATVIVGAFLFRKSKN